jgi:hypothetical protein
MAVVHSQFMSTLNRPKISRSLHDARMEPGTVKVNSSSALTKPNYISLFEEGKCSQRTSPVAACLLLKVRVICCCFSTVWITCFVCYQLRAFRQKQNKSIFQVSLRLLHSRYLYFFTATSARQPHHQPHHHQRRRRQHAQEDILINSKTNF